MTYVESALTERVLHHDLFQYTSEHSLPPVGEGRRAARANIGPISWRRRHSQNLFQTTEATKDFQVFRFRKNVLSACCIYTRSYVPKNINININRLSFACAVSKQQQLVLQRLAIDIFVNPASSLLRGAFFPGHGLPDINISIIF